MKHFILTIFIVLFAGCASLVPSERHESQSVKTTEAINTENEKTIRRTLTVAPSIWTTARSNALAHGAKIAQGGNYIATDPGPYIQEDVSISSTTTTGAGSKDSAKGSSEISIPFAVKLAIGAVAILLLWLGVWLWRRTSVAADAAYKAADKGLAAVIGHVESAARTTTDPERLNQLNALLSVAEKERGKVGSKK